MATIKVPNEHVDETLIYLNQAFDIIIADYKRRGFGFEYINECYVIEDFIKQLRDCKSN